MALDQPAHGGPNYQGTIDANTAYNLHVAYAPTPDELIRARIVRLICEAGELMAALVNVRDGIEATRENEDNVRIVESEFAFARRSLERVAVKVSA